MKETLQYGACDENNWTESSAQALAVKFVQIEIRINALGFANGMERMVKIYMVQVLKPPNNFGVSSKCIVRTTWSIL